MVIQAANTLPQLKKIFVMRRGMKNSEVIIKSLEEIYSNLMIEVLPELTEGQACTAFAGFNAAKSQSANYLVQSQLALATLLFTSSKISRR